MSDQVSRSWRWSRKLNNPTTLDGVRLGFGVEYWRDRPDLPGYDLLVNDPLWQRLRFDPADELTSHLLDDLVDVATIIEYTVGRIEGFASEIEALVVSEGIEYTPDYPTGVGHPAVWKLYVETQNLLAWVRALSDRVSRTWQGQNWGILPAIRPDTPLHAAVANLHYDYRKAIGGARLISNLTLHGANLPRQVLVGPTGIEVTYPDTPTDRVDLLQQLSYSTKIDAVTESRRLLDAATTLVDGILDAFEEAAPDRFRKPA